MSVIKSKPVPPLTPEDLATERLAAAVESAIAAIEHGLTNLADEDDHTPKWSVSDLVKLLQLRTQLQGERPRTIRAYWVDDPHGSRGTAPVQIDRGNHNNHDHPEPLI